MSNVTLTFTADTIEAAYDQMWEALRGHRHVAPEPKTPEPQPDRLSKQLVDAEKRPVGRPRKVQPEPLTVPDDDDDMRQSNPEPEYVEVPVPNSKADPVAMEKLKQETVAKLPDMFAAGKVALMRAVLTKYGKGAKSFPEIEAKDFPEIAAALARGDGS